MQRYFVTKNKDNIVFTDSDKNHIKKVMRMKNDDLIEVCYDNKAYRACFVDVDNYSIKIIEELNNGVLIGPKVTVAQGLLREQKWDLILQKTTELGVHEIIPLSLERCNAKIEGKEIKKIERWNLICKEASEQSFRSYVPKVYNVTDLKELVKMDYDLKLFCSTAESVNYIKKVLQSNDKCDKILIVIGPEGGLTSKEEKLMIDNGFISVTLGNLILRTETAPMFILSVINYENWR